MEHYAFGIWYEIWQTRPCKPACLKKGGQGSNLGVVINLEDWGFLVGGEMVYKCRLSLLSIGFAYTNSHYE